MRRGAATPEEMRDRFRYWSAKRAGGTSTGDAATEMGISRPTAKKYEQYYEAILRGEDEAVVIASLNNANRAPESRVREAARKRCPRCEEEKPASEICSDGVYCIPCKREYRREWRAAHPGYSPAERERRRVADNNRYHANPETYREYQAQANAAVRKVVFDHYGWVCACPDCGATDTLSIDHVNGGGKQHRQEVAKGGGGVSFYRWIIRAGFPADLQTLCKSCNSSKAQGERCLTDHAADNMLALAKQRLAMSQ